MALIVLLYALFASVFILAKTALLYTTPLFLVGSRMAVAGVLMLGFIAFLRPNEWKWERRGLFRILQLAFFNIYLTNICEFWGLQYLTTFKTCFIYSLSPFVSAFLSYLIFSEKLNGRQCLGIAIGFMGFLPILLTHSATELSAGELGYFSWPELAVVGAALFSVYGWIVLRQLVREDQYSPLMANGLSMLVGGAMALIHSAAVETWEPVPVTEWGPFLAAAAGLILISNMICYNLYGWLLQRYSATLMSLAGFSTPLFTALFGWIYFGEVVTLPFYLSAVIVFIGLLVFQKEEVPVETPA